MRIKPRSITSHLESLEPRQLLTAVGFVDSIAAPLAQIDYAADIDGDGDLDFVSESQWREVTEDGPGRTFTFDFEQPESGDVLYVGDLDDDQTADIVTLTYNATRSRHELSWFPGVDGAGRFGAKEVILVENGQFGFADFDGDGDVDFARSFCDDACFVVTFVNDGQANFEVGQTIAASASQVAAVDVDRDQDLDLLLGSGWLENLNSEEGFVYREQLFGSESSYSYVGDIDGDAELDLIGRSDSERFAWLEAAAPNQLEVRAQFVSDFVDGLQAVVADFDADGDNDLAAITYRSTIDTETCLEWYAQGDDGKLSGGVMTCSSGTSTFGNIDAIDANLDGLIDLVIDNDVYHLNPETNTVDLTPEPLGPVTSSVREVVDIDGDGDLDLIRSSVRSDCNYGYGPCSRTITWSENRGSAASLYEHENQNLLVTKKSGEFLRSLQVFDVDGDGDEDLLYGLFDASTGAENSTIVWVERLDGQATFGDEKQIDGTRGELIAAEDFDGDGIRDLITRDGNTAYWQRGQAAATFAEPAAIYENVRYENLRAFDWDDDGDLDLLATLTVTEGTELVWIENGDSADRFEQSKTILPTMNGRRYSQFDVVDYEADGDYDLLINADLYRNDPDAEGIARFEAERILHENESVTYVGDFNGDGLLDIAAWRFDTREQTLYQTNDGGGLAVGPTVLAGIAADLDGDGDTDFVADSTWYQNRPLGDSDNDGVFSSSDLIRVMEAGLYEDEIMGNANFESGDWNGDGDFDSSDLVHVLANGRYEN